VGAGQERDVGKLGRGKRDRERVMPSHTVKMCETAQKLERMPHLERRRIAASMPNFGSNTHMVCRFGHNQCNDRKRKATRRKSS
jgi:hypothetical protein